MKTEFIYLLTLQHTGTWFLIGFLCDHPEVGGFVLEGTLEKFLSERKSGQYTCEGKDNKKIITEGIVPDKKNLLFGHIASHSFMKPPQLCHRQEMLVLVMPHPLVVTLRDPLRVMLTHYERIPDFEEGKSLPHKIMTWRLYFKYIAAIENVKEVVYFPIDLLQENEKLRLNDLNKIQRVYGLKNDDIANKWASEWGVFASYVSSDSEGKKAYDEGDLDWFEKNMPQTLQSLRESEDIIRPIMGRWYKNLLWWSS